MADDETLLTQREQMYRFLGRIYHREMDQALLKKVRGMRFPNEAGAAGLEEGYRMLEAYLRNPGYDPVTDLAVDYARTFLGAGIHERDAAYPYESVYTSPEKLIMQDARDQVVAIYLARGLHVSEKMDFPEDHVALELEFMARLCWESRRELKKRKALTDCFREQKKFLEEHLLNWVPAFCADVEKYASTDFYRAAAKITLNYLRLDQSLLADWISEKPDPEPAAKNG
jgi:anaerobic sulfite reductase subunit A